MIQDPQEWMKLEESDKMPVSIQQAAISHLNTPAVV